MVEQRIGIVNIGVCSPFGRGWSTFVEGVTTAKSGLVNHPELRHFSRSVAGIAPKKGFRSYLKTRKAAKLFTPAARLALDAAGQALSDVERPNPEEIGLFVAVGREPPDGGEAEPALVASERNGMLDEQLLASKGRDLYPPLLPLKTLPNMILAHISIQLDIRGENGAWAGGPKVGRQAFYSAYWALRENRCKVALVGAADSLVDLGQARDLLRVGVQEPPGEAAIFFCLKKIDKPLTSSIFVDWDGAKDSANVEALQIGYCGAAQDLLHLASGLVLTPRAHWGGFTFSSGAKLQ